MTKRTYRCNFIEKFLFLIKTKPTLKKMQDLQFLITLAFESMKTFY